MPRHQSDRLLTDFPQLHPQVPVRIEVPREPPAIVQDAHESEQGLCTDGIVYVIILEQLVRRIKEQQQENAFNDDLLKDAALIGVSEGRG